jgi:hypothetical protein
MISILYVDDEPGLLDIGKLYLEQSGDFEAAHQFKDVFSTG